jgi:DNA-binding IclR family transcriptional regulator
VGVADPKPAAHSQTLSRGLRALEILAEASGPISIAELAAALGLHRSIAYRILRTLEDHRLVLRDDRGLLLLGPRMAALARGVQRSLQAAARR